MLHAYLVDNPRLPSPAFLKLVSFDDDTDIVGSVRAEINSHNDGSEECRAGGALIWFDDRRDRLQYVAPELRLQERFGDVAKLHGRITCVSGRSYKYFGECFDWIPGGRSFWRAWLYTEDKKFDYDDVRTSKDQLARAFPDKIDHILSWSGMQRTLIGRSWSETRRWPRINYRRCTPLA
jgi:hypothetical protein